MGGTTCGLGARYNTILKEAMFYRFKWAQKTGEGSLHPRPEGRGIRDPPHSRCNKKRGAGLWGAKPRAGPSSTDDWVLVKRALCWNSSAVWPKPLALINRRDETSAMGGLVLLRKALWIGVCLASIYLPYFSMLKCAMLIWSLSLSRIIADIRLPCPNAKMKIWHHSDLPKGL